MKVVLPAPFGPRNPKHSPGAIERSMPCTPTARPYSLVRATASIA